jgi:predicted site-specific integrase-resolvase
MRLSKALDTFGTLKAIAEVLDVAPSTVAEWKKKGQIPVRFHASLKEAADSDEQFVTSKMPFEEALNYFGSVKDIAELMGVNPKTVYFWKDSGFIPSNSALKLKELMPN